MHVDKSFTKIQARVRPPPPIQAMPEFWEHLVRPPLPNLAGLKGLTGLTGLTGLIELTRMTWLTITFIDGKSEIMTH